VSYSNYRQAFVEACGKAGVPGRWTHDFRRTVARDLRRLGVDEITCMTVTGHASSAMFRRYAGIVDPSEQVAALAAREELLQKERAKSSNVMVLSTRRGKSLSSLIPTSPVD
jgi:integrase